VAKKLNDSGVLKVGKNVWLEAFEVMVYGQTEDGEDMALTEGPFRTREIAQAFAKAKYKGFDHSVLTTFVEEKWTRFRGLPRKGAARKKSKAKRKTS
jgi:hypothetical protein